MKTALGDIEIVSRLGADERTLAFDVLDGLTRPFKEIPPKHFYDTEGSRLFEAIMPPARVLPDPHRARDPRGRTRRRWSRRRSAAELVELGSGVPTKTLLLLDAMRDAGTLDRYVPFDVSEVVLTESAKMLVERYPGIRVFGVVGDFERHLDALPAGRGPARDRLPRRHDRQLPARLAAALPALARPARCARRTGCCSAPTWSRTPAVLEAAYNDSAGVTAAFNRNMLAVVNRELDADFDLDAFEHVAFYDREQEWIEMRLRALRPMDVHVGKLGLDVHFANREELRTEISAKFTRERLEADLRAAGPAPARVPDRPGRAVRASLMRRCASSLITAS